MWSVGCIMAELLAKEPLFNGQNEKEQIDKVQIFRSKTLGLPFTLLLCNHLFLCFRFLKPLEHQMRISGLVTRTCLVQKWFSPNNRKCYFTHLKLSQSLGRSNLNNNFISLFLRYNRLREKFPPTSFSGGPTLSEAGFDLLNKLLTYDPERVGIP